MKKLSLIALMLLVPALFAVSASATCTVTQSSGGWMSTSWTMYIPSTDCFSTTGNVSATTLSCRGYGGWAFGTNSTSNPGMFSATIDVPSNQVVQSSNHWDVELNEQFSSPSGSTDDDLGVDVVVTHPNGSKTYYWMLLEWNGSNGTLDGCSATTSPWFSAGAGDSIKVTVRSSNPTGTANIAAAGFIVVNYN